MSATYTKSKVNVYQAPTLREIVGFINNANKEVPTILKGDIITLTKEDDIWILVYYI